MPTCGGWEAAGDDSRKEIIRRLGRMMEVKPGFPLEALQALLPLAFAEDEGSGDITSMATIGPESRTVARILAKEVGTVAGLPTLALVFGFKGFHPHIELRCEEGASVCPGQEVAVISGATREILVCERILLNILQRLCGIASATRRLVDAVGPGGPAVLDTRKTLPGYRQLDKYAVRTGGGTNHRQGLFDQVLIKDNHIRACGTVRQAVDLAAEKYGRRFVIEAEVESLEELATLLDSPVDIVMLDNMSDGQMAEAVRMLRAKAPSVKIEASGNMNATRISLIKNLGLDYISVGALTHSVMALDMSMRFEDGILPSANTKGIP